MDVVQSILSFILVVVTGVYAYLTRQMVKEMRAAREAQSEAEIVATLIMLGPQYAKLRIVNAGSGPAFKVEIKFYLQPDCGNSPIWRLPVAIPGYSKDFLTPDRAIGGELPKFRATAAKYNYLIVVSSWSNIFGHKRNRRSDIELKPLVDSWYDGHNLIGPDEFPEQMDKIHKDLKAIKEELSTINSRELVKEFLASDEPEPPQYEGPSYED